MQNKHKTTTTIKLLPTDVDVNSICDQTIFKMLKHKLKWMNMNTQMVATHIVNLLDLNQIDGDGICISIQSTILSKIIKDVFGNNAVFLEHLNTEIHANILKIGDLWINNDNDGFVFSAEYFDSNQFIEIASISINKQCAEKLIEAFINLINYVSDGDMKRMLKNALGIGSAQTPASLCDA